MNVVTDGVPFSRHYTINIIVKVIVGPFSGLTTPIVRCRFVGERPIVFQGKPDNLIPNSHLIQHGTSLFWVHQYGDPGIP